jgi:hypothetical protein
LNFGATPRKCEDCLRNQFNTFKLSDKNNLLDLHEFWKLVIERIKLLSSTLKQQEDAKDKFFNPEPVDGLNSAATPLKT